MRIRRIVRNVLIPFILGLATVLLMFWTVSKLHSPEYSALVIAVMGLAFTLWLEAFREISNRIRNKRGLLSQLRIELIQNKQDIKSVLENCEQSIEASIPAPLRTHAWLAATSSPYFTSIDSSTVDELINIYNRLDAANYYADIFKRVKYSPQAGAYALQTADSSQRLYVTIVRVASGQIDTLLAKIEEQINKLKEY